MSNNEIKINLQNYDTHISVKPLDLSNSIDHIPAKVYKVSFDPDRGEIILIKDQDNFTTPDKVYGDLPKHERIIIDDFKTTEKSLGVILSGLKGSGKSLLAERISNHYIRLGLPVFYVVEKVPHELLKTVIRVAGPCVVYFDEFEKNYRCINGDDGVAESGDQAKMLSFFSDSNHKKVLFLITTNNKSFLSQFMLDRPSRFKYHIRHTNASELGIKELTDEFKLNVWQEKILTYFGHSLSYDGLLSIIKILIISKDITDFNEKISILNIAHPVRITVKEIYHKDGACLKVDDEEFTGIISTGYTDRHDRTSLTISTINGENKPTYSKVVEVDKIIDAFMTYDDICFGIPFLNSEIHFMLCLKSTEHSTAKGILDYSIQNYHHQPIVNGYNDSHRNLATALHGEEVTEDETPNTRGNIKIKGLHDVTRGMDNLFDDLFDDLRRNIDGKKGFSSPISGKHC